MALARVDGGDADATTTLTQAFGLTAPAPTAPTSSPSVSLAPSPVPTTPTAGQGVALDAFGRIPASVISLSASLVSCSGDLVTTTTFQDLPGCSISVKIPGIYLVFAVFDFDGTATGWTDALGRLVVGGTALTPDAILADTGTTNCRGTIAQIWMPTVSASLSAPVTVKLQAAKLVNGGTLTAHQTHSNMAILRVG